MSEEQAQSKKQDDNEKLSKIDKFNLGLGLFNLVGVFASIFISIWGINASERIAEKSGAFDKGELKLSFGGYFIYPNIDFDVYYGVDFSDSTLHFATLPLGIHNDGKKTLDNVNLLLKYPHLANIAISDSLMKFEAIFTDPIDRKFFTVEPYDQVSFKFNSINPNFSIEAGDLICVPKETMGQATFPVTTKDSSTINITTTYQYSYPIKIALTAKDAVTEQYNFILNYRREIELDKLIKQVIKDKLAVKEKSKEKFVTSFFVIIPKVDKVIGDKKHRMTFMNSNSSNTLFCQFDKTMKFFAIMNQNGTVQQQIEISKL